MLVGGAFKTVLLGLLLAAQGKGAYTDGVNHWRKIQESYLTAPEGWLSVAGLYWLHDGDNYAGSDLASDLVLPASLAARVGDFDLTGGQVDFHVSSSSSVSKDGVPFTMGVLKPDQDRVKVGECTLMVIHRGSRIGVRLFDPKCKGRTDFKGMKWFPVSGAFKVKARFIPYAADRTIPITNVLGDVSMSPNPGYVTFMLRGKSCRLEAQAEGGGLFLNFQDETTGKSTYPAGRFLNTDAPVQGTVEIDFNRAVNPPCAFTSFATCPLPPKENKLPVAVEAGEKTHHSQD
jgi:uncharacterized protein (DUF1684 family)